MTDKQKLIAALKILDDIFFDNHGNQSYWEDEAKVQYDTIKEALTACIEDGWMDISSCPSDGSPVWVFRPRNPVSDQVIEAMADGEWWRSVNKESRYPITHWMPHNKPQPPKDTK